MPRALLALLFAVGCASPVDASPLAYTRDAVEEAAGQADEIDVAELQTVLDKGAVLIDVRTEREFASGHIAGAVNIPLQSLSSRLGEIDNDQPVYLVCRSGSRSGAATRVLAGQGYHAVNVDGGMIAWSRAGLAVAR